jgi:hypothetical protein
VCGTLMMDVAEIAVFGKGFRVTLDSEEFQRLVPKDTSALHGELELKLREYKGWAPLLEPLYSLPAREIAMQYCLLLGPGEVMSVAFAATEDRHHRPSIVAVSATMRILWDSPELADSCDRCVGLAMRLATEYGIAFAGNPARVANQLSRGVFLRERAMDLRNEKSTASLDWPLIVQAIRNWQGINGIATLRLCGLGANVIVGTRHEAALANVRGTVDGYYDVRERRIVPLTDGLRSWPKAPPEASKSPAQEDLRSPEKQTLNSIDQSLKGIDASLRNMNDSLSVLTRMLLDMWFPRRRDDERGPKR